MSQHDLTLIDRLAGLTGAGPALRRNPALWQAADDEYRQLLHPEWPGAVSLIERRAVAAFAAVLYDEDRTRAHFLDLLVQTDPARRPLAVLIEAEAEGLALADPYGAVPGFPAASAEDGRSWHMDPALRAELGERLAAALDHAQRIALTAPPGVAGCDHDALTAAGWTPEAIGLLTRIVEMVGQQARIVAGLRGCLAAGMPAAVIAAE